MTNRNINDMLLGLQGNMLNYALILTSDRSVAYSLLQRATLAVLDEADGFDGDADGFEPWVFSIMKRLSERSGQCDRPQIASETGAVGHIDGVDCRYLADRTPDGCHSVDSVMFVLEGMPPRIRAIVTMHLQGATPAEIAASEIAAGRSGRHIEGLINQAVSGLLVALGEM